jgi:hypothetical protein
VAGRVEEDRVHEHLRGESRSRGRQDGSEPRRAFTLWRRRTGARRDRRKEGLRMRTAGRPLPTCRPSSAQSAETRLVNMGMRPSRETLASMLRRHGEDDLAERAPSFTDDEMARIGTLGAYYAWSEDAFVLGSGMGGARALALATIDVIEGNQRDLRWHHSKSEIENMGLSREPDPREREIDRSLRLHAAERQRPS